jgi:exosortase
MSEKVRPKQSVDWVTLAKVLLPSWLAFGWLAWQVSWYWSHKPDMSFGWIVLILCGFLITEVAPSLPPPRLKWSFPSVVLLVLGLAALVLFQLYQAAFGTMPASLMALAFGSMAVITANILHVYGPSALGTLGFAFFFLLIALPLPSFIQNLVVSNLQNFVAAIDEELLNLIGIPAERKGSVIQLTTGQVGVDDACSGFRSLQSSIMAALFIGFLLFKTWGWRIALGFLSVFLAVLGNLGRTFYLCYQGASKGTDAVKGVHDAAGWSVMLFTAVGVGIASWLVLKLQKLQAAYAAQAVEADSSNTEPDSTPAPPGSGAS